MYCTGSAGITGAYQVYHATRGTGIPLLTAILVPGAIRCIPVYDTCTSRDIIVPGRLHPLLLLGLLSVMPVSTTYDTKVGFLV